MGVLMEPRTTAKSPKQKIRRFLAKLTPMEMEKSAWKSSLLKSLRSSKRFHGEISTGQRLLHLLFNSLIDSRFDFFLSFFSQILTFPIFFSIFLVFLLFSQFMFCMFCFFSHGINERQFSKKKKKKKKK